MAMSEIILFNKPYRVLSQFTDREPGSEARATLADFIHAPGFRPAGRLDYDSEGLLVLTADGSMQQRIAHPRGRQRKVYWVQVEGSITEEACRALRRGVQLKDGLTRPAEAQPIAPPAVWPRHPPIRQRKTVTDTWLEVVITEGRNRQVRRMTAAVGFPTLRLIRVAVGPWQIDDIEPGGYRRVSAQ